MWPLNAGGVNCCKLAFHPGWSGDLHIIVVWEIKINMNVSLMGHYVRMLTFSNVKRKHAKDSSYLNLTQLVTLFCYYVSDFKNSHLAIFVSIQRHLLWKGGTETVFAFLQENFKFWVKLSWNPQLRLREYTSGAFVLTKWQLKSIVFLGGNKTRSME